MNRMYTRKIFMSRRWRTLADKPELLLPVATVSNQQPQSQQTATKIFSTNIIVDRSKETLK